MLLTAKGPQRRLLYASATRSTPSKYFFAFHVNCDWDSDFKPGDESSLAINISSSKKTTGGTSRITTKLLEPARPWPSTATTNRRISFITLLSFVRRLRLHEPHSLHIVVPSPPLKPCFFVFVVDIITTKDKRPSAVDMPSPSHRRSLIHKINL